MKLFKTLLPALAITACLVLSGCGEKKKKGKGGGDDPSASNMENVEGASRIVDYGKLDWKDDVYYFDGKPYTGKAEKKEKGKRTGSYTFVEGMLEGPTREYYPSGEIMVSTNFKEGKRDGANVYFNEDGTTMKSQVYQMDKLIKSSDPSELAD